MNLLTPPQKDSKAAFQLRQAKIAAHINVHLANGCDYDTAFGAVSATHPELFVNSTPPMPPGPASLIERLQQHPENLQPTGCGPAKPDAAMEAALATSKAKGAAMIERRRAILEAANGRSATVQRLLTERATQFPEETYDQRWAAVVQMNPKLFAEMQTPMKNAIAVSMEQQPVQL